MTRRQIVPSSKGIKTSTAGSAALLLLLLVAIGTSAVALHYFQLTKHEQLFKSNTVPVVSTSSFAQWAYYHDDNLSFAFKYPHEWGAVESNPGNRSREGKDICPGVEAAGSYRRCIACLHFYDKSLTFSGPLRSELTIYAVKFSTQDATLRLCDATHRTQNLLNDWNVLKAQSPTRFFKTKSEFEAFESGFTSEYDTDVSDDFIFSKNGVWVEALINFAPRNGSAELKEADESFGCSRLTLSPAPGCLVIWLQYGRTAAPIRAEFQTLKAIVNSFEFAD
jgi:hypothetical protein